MTTILTISTPKFAYLASDRAVTTNAGQFNIQKHLTNEHGNTHIAIAGQGSMLLQVQDLLNRFPDLDGGELLKQLASLPWAEHSSSGFAINSGRAYLLAGLIIECDANKLYGIGSGADVAIGKFEMPNLEYKTDEETHALMKEALTIAIQKASTVDQNTNATIDILFSERKVVVPRKERYELKAKDHNITDNDCLLAPSVENNVLKVPCIVSTNHITHTKKRLYTANALQKAAVKCNTLEIPLYFAHKKDITYGFWSDFKVIENKNGMNELHATANITNPQHFAFIQSKYNNNELKASITIMPKEVIQLVNEFDYVDEISFVSYPENTNCYALSEKFETPKDVTTFLRTECLMSKKSAENLFYNIKQIVMANKEIEVGNLQNEQVGNLQANSDIEIESKNKKITELKMSLQKVNAELDVLTNAHNKVLLSILKNTNNK